MNRYRINTLAQYLQVADDPLAFLFRGVTRPEYKLLPSVARGFRPSTFPLRRREDRLLSEFKRRAIPWLTTFVPTSDWEWLILARHHGVPTRLLDWTTNPLAALYFACASEQDADGTVYVLKRPVELALDAEHSSFVVDDLYYVRPPHISQRVLAQASCFTVSPKPEDPVTEPWVVAETVIGRSDKDAMRRAIGRYGISEATLFPGLDGLGRELKQAVLDENADHSMPCQESE